MSALSAGKATPENRAGIIWGAVHVLILAFAVWLVSPLIIITASDYLAKNSYGLRLALGLLIFIIYVGKWSFDVFAPQGLARKVSRLKTAALVVYILVVVSFMIYIVAQAASLYLQSAVSEAENEAGQVQTRLDVPPLIYPEK